MTTTRQIADRVETTRRSRDMTRRDLARAAEIPERKLRRRMTNPDGLTVTELHALMRALEMPLEAAFGSTDAPA